MILCPLRTCFFNTHSEWLELSLAASSCKHVIMKNRHNMPKGRWIVTIAWQGWLNKNKLLFTEIVYAGIGFGFFLPVRKNYPLSVFLYSDLSCFSLHIHEMDRLQFIYKNIYIHIIIYAYFFTFFVKQN